MYLQTHVEIDDLEILLQSVTHKNDARVDQIAKFRIDRLQYNTNKFLPKFQ